MSAADTPVTRAEAPWFRSVTFHGLLSSLTPLIPLPLLDDWAAAWVERRQVIDTFRRRGIKPERWHLEVLTWDGKQDHKQGCLTPILMAGHLVLYVLKKIFRKLLVFLMLKDCVDQFSTSYHHGFLLHLAFERGAIDDQVLAGGERLIEVRLAMLRTCEAIDPRPLNRLVGRVLGKSRRALLSASRTFGRLLSRERRAERRGEPVAEGEAATGGETIPRSDTAFEGLVERLSSELWSDESYRARLETLFIAALARRS